ncbi:MAG TPA: post-COAP-1 domain-containing protein, partial [Opitutaceae bacterium]|nr:post-COAP-1 domain-containing protein [Opitutaceae bacterium]
NGTPPAVEEDCGKVTGGGWIIGTPSGAKGTFGMSGGIRRGEFWGHLTYQDHGTGMKVQSTAVTGFRNDPSDPKGRIITYSVTIAGAPGTATLRVVDNGEPGRNDIFDLTLSTGYHAAGDLGGGRPGGGNIQLHKCPPGWE